MPELCPYGAKPIVQGGKSVETELKIQRPENIIQKIRGYRNIQNVNSGYENINLKMISSEGGKNYDRFK